ncbi:unnamed protein product, partial [Scytosiphon promiscuus]
RVIAGPGAVAITAVADACAACATHRPTINRVVEYGSHPVPLKEPVAPGADLGLVPLRSHRIVLPVPLPGRLHPEHVRHELQRLVLHVSGAYAPAPAPPRSAGTWTSSCERAANPS